MFACRSLYSKGRIYGRVFHKNALLRAAHEIQMPAMSPTMTEGAIKKWNKKEGDKVQVGDVLFEIETDKAQIEVETQEEGILAKILEPEKTPNIEIGRVIGYIVDEGDDWKNFKVPPKSSTTQSPIQPKQTTDETTEKKTIESTPPPQKSTSDEKLKSTQQPSSSSSSHFPSVSRLLAEYNIDISKISPTGPKNRVLKGDVLQYIDENKLQKAPRQDKKPQPKQDVKKPSTPQSSKIKFVDIPIPDDNKNYLKSYPSRKNQIPHTYLKYQIPLNGFDQFKNELFENEQVNVTFESFLTRAIARSIQLVPEANAVWRNDQIEKLDTLNISIGSLSRNGTEYKTLKNLKQIGLLQIQNQLSNLATSLSNEASFTIINFDGFDVSSSTEILNESGGSILTVSSPSLVPVLNEETDTVQISKIATFTLTYDERSMDQETAQEFFKHLTTFISSPKKMI